MPTKFNCEACNAKSDTLALRNSDGKWVCASCVPTEELEAMRVAVKRDEAARAKGE